jgi:radical SAM superfamily enzyme YgiQ (UPF0313 family)
MRIHLVTPRNPPSFWTFDSILPTLGRRCLVPNLSMPTVAGITPRGHEITLCDENVESVDWSVNADVVGITGYIVHRQRMRELAAEFRRRGRLVVAGGPFVSSSPDALRDVCDVAFVGEAEETWPRFLDDLAKGCFEQEYRAPRMPDLTHAPPPRLDLLRTDCYQLMAVQTTRGCPFHCDFCDVISLYGRRPRSKSVANVMTEIEACHRLGAEQVFVVDDNVVGHPRRARELLEAIARWQREHGFPLVFNAQASLNAARDPALLGALRDAGFVTLFVGVETPRRASLEEVGKLQNLRSGDLVEAVRAFQAHGIQVQAGMIVGFDHDDPEVFAEQLRFAEEARIPVSMTGMLQALPGTPLHARLAREGRLIGESEGDQFLLSNVEPHGLSRLELYRGYRGLLAALYDPAAFRARTLAFLRERGRRAAPARLPGRRELRLLARILRDTVLGTGMRRAASTLALLCTTLARHPSAFRDAVAFAAIYKALADYVEELSARLDSSVAVLEGAEAAFGGPEPRRVACAAGRSPGL